MNTGDLSQLEKHSKQTGARINAAAALVIGVCSLIFATEASLAAEAWSSSDSDKDGWHNTTVIGSSTSFSTFFLTVAPILPPREYRYRTGGRTFRVSTNDSAQAFVAYDPGTSTARAIYWPDRVLLSRSYAGQIQVNAMALIVCTGNLNWNFGPTVTNLVPAVGTTSSAVSGCPGNRGTPTHLGGFFSAVARNL